MTVIQPGSVIGIIGGGQLGRMSALAAASLGFETHIYSDIPDSPASHVASKTTVAPYDDTKAMEAFARSVDVVTFEFENIPYKSVEALESFATVRPNSQALYLTQNRLREKDFINNAGIKTARYQKVTSVEDLEDAVQTISPHGILKTVEMGYDGKGQDTISPEADLHQVWQGFSSPIGIFEEKIAFTKEISVIIARNTEGKMVSYTPSENVHKDGILDSTTAPANISSQVKEHAKNIAETLAEKMQLIGVIAVEMFLTKDNDILVNEIAPRPHNSGHWTVDGCITSQFEQFIRAICGLPLGDPSYHTPVIMKNLIGSDIHQWESLIKDPDIKLHLYGKREARKGRKMGHYNRLLKAKDL